MNDINKQRDSKHAELAKELQRETIERLLAMHPEERESFYKLQHHRGMKNFWFVCMLLGLVLLASGIWLMLTTP